MRVLLSFRHVESIKVVLGTLFIVNIVLVGPLNEAYCDENELSSQAIFRSVMSPYCPGRLLSDCPSGEAEDLRNSIRRDILNGKKEEEVILALVEKFGPSVRAAPQAEGIGLLAWAIPIAFPLIGFLVYIGFLRKKESSS